jgi:GT2 family glycosyltransferase
MRVSCVVATYGAQQWARRGRIALDSAVGFAEAFSLHLDGGNLALARNTAAAAAECEWLCFLDADDELSPGFLDAMKLALHAYKWGSLTDVQTESGSRPTRLGELLPPALLVPAVQYLDPAGVPLGEPAIPDWDRNLYDVNCAVVGTLVPRTLFASVGGFDERWAAYEDWELWLRCVRAGARLVPVPAAVYRARAALGSRNRQARTVLDGAYKSIRAEHADVPASVWAAAKGTPR